MPTSLHFRPDDPTVRADPYPFYESLRDGPPATYIEEDDLWVVSSFEHVRHVLRHPDLFSSKAIRALQIGGITAAPGTRPDLRELDAALPKSLIASDPPDHTAMRRLVSQPFTPRSIASLTERTEQIAADLVDGLIAAAAKGNADLVTHLTYPLPVMVIAEALGIPSDRHPDFKRWSDALIGLLDGNADLERLLAERREMNQFFTEVIDQKTMEPGDDLISWIVTQSNDRNEMLETDDLVSFATLLLVAGNETTTNLLGNGFQAFFDNPEQETLMRTTDDLTSVVEEIVRYDSPVQGILRLTNDAVHVGGVTIPPESVVMILFGSANRDTHRWDDAATFNVDREPLDHLGFGSGIHLCLGAHLARLEAVCALNAIRIRTSCIEPRGTAVRTSSGLLRGFTSLPVHIVSSG